MESELDGVRVLIVEDEPAIADIVDVFLGRENALRLIARDGDDALSAAAYWRPQLIVLDLKLPKRDGYAVLAELRARGGPPVIILSALGEDVDKLTGFRLGCDDYLVKPFNPLELIARAKAVLRRKNLLEPSRIVTLGDLQVDLDRHVASVGETLLELTPTEFRILRVLAERAGRLVSRGQLVDSAMDGEAFDKSVNPHISRLRQKLEVLGNLRLVSVRSEGYRLEVFQ
ncbi:MAG: response regulator transcription factor [Phenylobacterium sp.]|jgi:two-component system response regulator AdeR|uniref:response regulator transcription factor n=1 Tax=Phenylobacterium sp. TaxID=1871053 RepID=UPI0025D05759|nr:response regulator transcription factor [Phenylobacterium sp.]MCA3740839.1 response regulator transcription factor [Phenylobacterium sp.]MCA6224414.1 response regulator transcription factor [Phenylobacterium sp.]MCA6225731.1 response regulator transcription factor [Phenylobacterium sp.]MCA6231125.1 response regulator transcription factor [Phenylobacterium sp.]MCA6233777.1 response regulator transcription factor [Phenylobacterium sp.]